MKERPPKAEVVDLWDKKLQSTKQLLEKAGSDRLLIDLGKRLIELFRALKAEEQINKEKGKEEFPIVLAKKRVQLFIVSEDFLSKLASIGTTDAELEQLSVKIEDFFGSGMARHEYDRKFTEICKDAAISPFVARFLKPVDIEDLEEQLNDVTNERIVRESIFEKAYDFFLEKVSTVEMEKNGETYSYMDEASFNKLLMLVELLKLYPAHEGELAFKGVDPNVVQARILNRLISQRAYEPVEIYTSL